MRAGTPAPGRRRWMAAAAGFAAVATVALLATRGDAPAAPAAPRPAPAVATPAPAPAPAPAAAPLPEAAPAAPTARPVPASFSPGSEEHLMEVLRAEVDERPELAIALAEQGDALFPSGRQGDERAYLHMRALVHLGDIGKARTVAGEFFERYPESPLGRTVFRLTGMRPRPRLGPPS